jgi:hypothetical protein
VMSCRQRAKWGCPLEYHHSPNVLSITTHLHIVTATMDDNITHPGAGNSQVPTQNHNFNHQIPPQNAVALAFITLALDGRYPQMSQQEITKFYPNSIPTSDLVSGHNGTIRMFAPQRYLPPNGTYFIPENPEVQIPEGVGSTTSGGVNRCRTCHKLLSDHARPPYNRGAFTCPDLCAFSSVGIHTQHPNAVSKFPLI